MRHFIQFPLFTLLLLFLIATIGCQDSGSSAVDQVDPSHQGDHDHGDHDHGDHDQLAERLVNGDVLHAITSHHAGGEGRLWKHEEGKGSEDDKDRG